MIILKYYQDAYIFEDLHKYKPRLNVAAHGDIIDYTICIDRRNRTAFEIKNILQPFLFKKNYSSIRFISCRSGYGGLSAFVCQLSKLIPDKTIKGYLNVISTSPTYMPEKIKETIHSFPRSAHLRIIKSWKEDFHSITYLNGMPIKNTPHRSLRF